MANSSALELKDLFQLVSEHGEAKVTLCFMVLPVMQHCLPRTFNFMWNVLKYNVAACLALLAAYLLMVAVVYLLVQVMAVIGVDAFNAMLLFASIPLAVNVAFYYTFLFQEIVLPLFECAYNRWFLVLSELTGSPEVAFALPILLMFVF